MFLRMMGVIDNIRWAGEGIDRTSTIWFYGVGFVVRDLLDTCLITRKYSTSGNNDITKSDQQSIMHC